MSTNSRLSCFCAVPQRFCAHRYDEDVQELCFLALECFDTVECNEAVDAFWEEWELANADPDVLFERKTRADWMRSRDVFAEVSPETVDARLLMRARFIVSDQDRRNKARFFGAQAAAIKLQATVGRGALARIAMDDHRDELSPGPREASPTQAYRYQCLRPPATAG